MRIAVCILTYKRVEGLKKALQSLCSQRLDSSLFTLTKVVVLDNEVNSVNESCCHEMLKDINVLYVPEPKKGISHARNSAILAAKNDVDCIAFLDDDEEAAADWLYELASAMKQSQADVVTGNVISLFHSDTPEWVINSRYFDRLVHRHLDEINYARSGNVLVRVSVFTRCGFFDESFSQTGGEDTVFFNKASALGETIVWSSRAMVYETVDKSRCNLEWILKRTLRTTGTTVISDMMTCKRKYLTGLYFFIRGISRLGVSLFIIPLSLLGGQVARLKSLKLAARGVGMIMGVFGYHHKEYLNR